MEYLEIIKSLKNTFLALKEPDMHLFTYQDFNLTNPEILKFSPKEKEKGYKKVLFDFDFFDHLKDKSDILHLDPCIVLTEKINGKNVVCLLNGDDYGDFYKDTGLSLVMSNITNPLITTGCIEYALLVLKSFDGTVLKKMEDGSLKTVNIKDVKNGDIYATKEQLKLRQSSDILEKLDIKSKYNPRQDAKNEVFVTDSKGRSVLLDKYYDKYTIEIEKRGKIFVENKRLNALTVCSRDNTTYYREPRDSSIQNMLHFEKIANRTSNTSHRLLRFFRSAKKAQEFTEQYFKAEEEQNKEYNGKAGQNESEIPKRLSRAAQFQTKQAQEKEQAISGISLKETLKGKSKPVTTLKIL